MSILGFPRLNFSGQIFFNPDTANNDDVLDLMEPVSMSLKFPLTAMTDAMALQLLQEGIVRQANRPGDMRTFVKSGWNLYGDHAWGLKSTSITSFVDRNGPQTSGQLIGATVTIPGSQDSRPGQPIMVDVDCSGLVTTQFWTGGLILGPTTAPILQCFENSRGFQRRLSFSRTRGALVGEQNFMNFGCTMQYGLHRQNLVFAKTSDAAIVALIEAIWPDAPDAMVAATAPAGSAVKAPTPHGPHGVVVRMSYSEAEPNIDGKALVAEFAAGRGTPNPSWGYLIGTLGVWEQGELATETPGRFLTVSGDYMVLPPRFAFPNATYLCRSQDDRFPELTLATDTWMPGNVIGTLHENPDGSGFVSLDLVNFLQWDSYRNNPARPGAQGFDYPVMHADMGPLTITSIASGVGPETAAIRYGGGDVAQTAGVVAQGCIVDLPIPPSSVSAWRAGNWSLSVRMPSPVGHPMSTTVSREVTTRVETDTRGRYMTIGAIAPLLVQVTAKGQPVTTPVTLFLTSYQNSIDTPSNTLTMRPDQTVHGESGVEQWRWRPVVSSSPGGNVATVLQPDANQKYIEVQGTPDSDGYLQIPMLARDYGPGMLAISTPETFGKAPFLDPLNPNWGSAYYACYHVLYDGIDTSSLYDANGMLTATFEQVYHIALRYFAVLFPAMKTYIDLADETSMSTPQVAAFILKRTEWSEFASTHYMPITKAWPISHRKLVRDWCLRVLGAPPETTPPPAVIMP